MPRAALWPVVGLLFLLACHTDHTPLEDRVYSATAAEWAAAGLPEPRESCRLEEFRFEQPKTLEAYLRACLPHSWACLRWRLEAPRVRSLPYPAAVVNPELPSARIAAVGVHELLHAMGSCARLWDDFYDYQHTDPRVWRPNQTSVEAKAQADLYGAPAGGQEAPQ